VTARAKSRARGFISEFNDLVAVAFAVAMSRNRDESRTVFASQGPSRAAIARARLADVFGNRGVGRNVARMADRFFVAVKLVAERGGHVFVLAFGLIPFGTGKPRASEEVAGRFAKNRLGAVSVGEELPSNVQAGRSVEFYAVADCVKHL